ncbi:MAG: phage integrase central domain-containing protein [Rubrivivax sp.]
MGWRVHWFLTIVLLGGDGGQPLRDLERLACPHLGQSTIGSVTTDSVLGVLLSIWTSKPAVATKLRGKIERVLDYAGSQGAAPPASAPGRRVYLQDRLHGKPMSAAVDVAAGALPIRAVQAILPRVFSAPLSDAPSHDFCQAGWPACPGCPQA